MENIKYHDGWVEVNLNPNKNKEKEDPKAKSGKKARIKLATIQLVVIAFTLGYLTGARDTITNTMFELRNS